MFWHVFSMFWKFWSEIIFYGQDPTQRFNPIFPIYRKSLFFTALFSPYKAPFSLKFEPGERFWEDLLKIFPSAQFGWFYAEIWPPQFRYFCTFRLVRTKFPIYRKMLYLTAPFSPYKAPFALIFEPGERFWEDLLKIFPSAQFGWFYAELWPPQFGHFCTFRLVHTNILSFCGFTKIAIFHSSVLAV